jgi:hypothetical protein
VITDVARTGSYAARIGAATTGDPITQTSYSSFEQAFSVPADALTVTVSFARYRWSGDVISDTQYFVVIDQANQPHYLVSERIDDPTWWSMVRSEAVPDKQSLWFGVVNKGDQNGTGMVIDDVQTHICTRSNGNMNDAHPPGPTTGKTRPRRNDAAQRWASGPSTRPSGPLRLGPLIGASPAYAPSSP